MHDQAVLISKVENYLIKQGFINPGNNLQVVTKYPGYLVAYLPETEFGILGCGETIDCAFDDFTENFHEKHPANYGSATIC